VEKYGATDENRMHNKKDAIFLPDNYGKNPNTLS
jgi:hypothetical protein